MIQSDTINLLSGSYYFINTIPTTLPIQSTVGKSELVQINTGDKIALLYEDKKDVYFEYWDYTGNELGDDQKFKNDNTFKMDKAQFKSLTKPLYSRYKGATAGAYSIPFRLRGAGSSDFEFETSLSLQANVIFGFGSLKSNKSIIDASVGIGITGVNLNSKNSLVLEERSASALTLSLGAVIKPAKYANIGVFVGWDFLDRKDSDVKWIHNGKPWLGLGINITFNEVETSSTASKGTQ